MRKCGKENGTKVTEKGEELANSIKFRKMLRRNNCNLHANAPECSFQIGKVERLHQTLEGMMTAMLLGSDLSSKFWSDAMMNVV